MLIAFFNVHCSVELKRDTWACLLVPLTLRKTVCHWSAMNPGIGWAGKDPPMGAFVCRGWNSKEPWKGDSLVALLWRSPSSHAASEGWSLWIETHQESPGGNLLFITPSWWCMLSVDWTRMWLCVVNFLFVCFIVTVHMHMKCGHAVRGLGWRLGVWVCHRMIWGVC